MDETGVSPLGLGFTLLMGVLILFLPRRLAFLPMAMGACYITLGQSVSVAGLNFYMVRFLILFAWVRIIVRREIFAVRMNSIDRVFLLWLVSTVATYTLLRMTGDALVNRLGFAFNAIGSYFVFRSFVRDYEDIETIVKWLALLIIPLAVAMVIEKATGRNPFSLFGGVPEFTQVREGRIRCQGPFQHPILAGTFGATLVPLFIASWWRGTDRIKIAVVGLAAATTITITSASSGPVMSYVFGIIGLLFWRYRSRMRAVRWAFVLFLLLAHLLMQAPVWYLIAKVSRVMGGTGWHRSYLIDQAIRYFPDWWLLGTKITSHWFPYALPGNADRADITNQFIVQGVNGGLITMLLFILIIVRCYRNLGRIQTMIPERPFSIRIIFWALGATLFAHIVSFVSVSYFDQIIVFWYLLLAIIASSTEFLEVETVLRSRGKRLPVPG